MTRGLNTPARNASTRMDPAPGTATLSTGPSRRMRVLRRSMLVAAFGLFGAAAALGMVQTDPHEALPPLRQVQDIITLPPESLEASAPAADDTPYVHETRIRQGDTLASVLARLDVDAPGLQRFLTHDASARSIYKLYPGRSVQAATDAAGNLRWLRYIHTPGNESDGEVVTRLLQVEPTEDGYKAAELTHQTERQVRVAVGTITSSLFGATDAAGVPDSITLQMAEILGSRIDFLRDLRQGDQFRVVYEVRTHEGRYAGAGRVLAVEFVNRGKSHTAVWFSPEGQSGSYYAFDGTSLRGAFLRTALKFTRISSKFGGRMHPIHKRWIGHKGVDYAAPTGTPIHATADGVVHHAGWMNGYGNTVHLQHHGKYSTLYAHASRLAPGLKKGDKVRQGQVIAYVGATGWATGPHLHYEFRINGTPVDPLSVDLPVARALEAKELKAFQAAVQPYTEQIKLLTQFQQTLPEELANVASR
ncbi:peptidoglycan DD-metalloendopeptidase family protein [Orrella sp. JC864]|uniref:M23 family metallopeptidase n=1 Tax=Orrella sp. JC864 TaxID=3120298 RepID=UPI0030092E72